MVITVTERRMDVLRLAVRRAAELPCCEVCGLWAHGDLRDNVYFAMHGIALELEEGDSQTVGGTLFEKCVDVLDRMLALQQADPGQPMYGHWPLSMPASHQNVRPHELPVELMGCLLAVFAQRYGDRLPVQLRTGLDTAIRHVYESRFYDREVAAHSHHEAKWTAHQLLHGVLFDDEALLKRGAVALRALISRLRERGMREYGSLPWFWHWAQAMACAWEVLPAGAELRGEVEAMLRLLWEERSRWYLRGAWAGPHSRALPHDIPTDRYVLYDYVQFGDFSLDFLGGDVPRLEGAGLLRYEVPADIREAAVRLETATELRQKIVLEAAAEEKAIAATGVSASVSAEDAATEVLASAPVSVDGHMYLYRTPLYAIGGMWERTHEYLNEQHRWDVTLPVRMGSNQLYLFHPGEGYAAGDARHAGDGAHVAFARHAVLAVHAIADEAPEGRLVGRLPAGAWRFDADACFGEVDGVYLAVRSLRPLQAAPLESGGYALASAGRFHAILVEAWSAQEAAALGLAGLDAFAAAVLALPLQAEHGPDGRPVRAFCGTLDGAALALAAPNAPAAAAAPWQPYVDGVPVDFSGYRVMTR